MKKPMQLEFISDIVCPWCVIGLRELERALKNLSSVIDPKIRLQPFELNPDLPREGQSLADLYKHKFGKTFEAGTPAREAVRSRANDVGFTIAMTAESRIHNTFDAHRLLHWAGTQDRHVALKHALFTAHFTQGRDIADADVLADLAQSVGLNAAEAKEILASGRYGAEVRQAEEQWRTAGVNSVPAIIVNGIYIISGAQPAAVFEKALREIAGN